MEYKHTSMRVSDAVFKSVTPIRNGRIYALMQESPNTGIAIANPNSEPVVINFNYADAAGAAAIHQSAITASRRQVIYIHR